MKLSMFDIIVKLQEAMNSKGEQLKIDGALGPKTLQAMEKYDFEIEAFLVADTPKQIPEPPIAPPPAPVTVPPWYSFAKKFSGKKETDPEFNKEMSKKWSLFGLNLGTIATSSAAWCGLAMAVALSGVGLDYAKNGALARNWASYGVAIDWKRDGIPLGAIVQINHNLNCKASDGNHVAQAEGDCSPADLLKPGATIDLYGGNQGNTWKVSTFSAKEICSVRWPSELKDHPKPAPIKQSVKCTSKGATGSTTR